MDKCRLTDGRELLRVITFDLLLGRLIVLGEVG